MFSYEFCDIFKNTLFIDTSDGSFRLSLLENISQKVTFKESDFRIRRQSGSERKNPESEGSPIAIYIIQISSIDKEYILKYILKVKNKKRWIRPNLEVKIPEQYQLPTF